MQLDDDNSDRTELALTGVALMIRVLASPRPPRPAEVPALVYRAEAYEAGDAFREAKWGCSHEHDSVEHALSCGMAWLEEQTSLESA